jgi:hypothetical protein
MGAQSRLERFKASVKSDKESGCYLEDRDGIFRLWRDLSPQAKLDYLAGDAALYDVPFSAFSEEAREVFRDMVQAAMVSSVVGRRAS